MPTTVNPYLALLLMFFACSGFALTMLFLATVLGPKNKTLTKMLPFECGAIPVGSVRDQRFNVRFYLVAVLFILFDIEIIFMYPWAAVMTELGWKGLIEMLGFMTVLFVGLIYVWRKGVFNWND